MTRKLTVLFFIWQFCCHGQVSSTTAEIDYYRNGAIKFIATKKAKDTVELKKYYKRGRLKDSIWMVLTEKDEIPLGTSKSYHENGQVALITHYIKGNEQYISYEYTENNKLKRFEQRPTGLTKLYNRKGEQVVEYDYHKLKDVDVPSRFKNGKHLQNTRFEKRIKSKGATLSNGTIQKEIGAGALITLQLKKDTLIRTHCLVEGFSQDTIFMSRFHYNEDYQKGSDIDILKYDSTFAMPVKQIRSLLYAKHRTKKRVKTAQFCTLLGAELILIPLVPIAVLPFIGVEVLSAAKLYAAFAVPGAGIFLLGKYFFKSAVPKHYDLSNYRIIVKG